MSTVVSDGSQTCTVGVEHTLATSTLAASFVLYLDLATLQAGDILEVYLYRKVRSSSTLRRIVKQIFLGDDIAGGDDPVVQSIPIGSPGHQLSATLKQTAGVGRAIAWSLERV